MTPDDPAFAAAVRVAKRALAERIAKAALAEPIRIAARDKPRGKPRTPPAAMTAPKITPPAHRKPVVQQDEAEE
jgi:hypothetical protein